MVLFTAMIALLLAAVFVTAYPLIFEPVQALALDADAVEAEPFNERDTVLEQLSDLEQSAATGKLSDEDYALHKAELQRRYIELVESDTL